MKRITTIQLLLLTRLLVLSYGSIAQTGLTGKVMANEKPMQAASVQLKEMNKAVLTDSNGVYLFSTIKAGVYTLFVSSTGYYNFSKKITIRENSITSFNINLQQNTANLEDVVVTGTLKTVSRTQSPVPVEVYTPKYFQKNPAPSLFESIGMVNGVRPQLNCSVCNTGDIHINGMEGPYTLILIDGMPIVSSLSTVYGLNGIPNSIVERIEVVKGPASSLYGSEAIGGIVNVITKNPLKAPAISADVFATSHNEYNIDASAKITIGKAQTLIGINYFNYQNRMDKNNDGFTDITLQNRISVFNKWSLQRKDNRVASLAARFVYEDRWGGETNWSKQWRGSDSIYGESIYTKRVELIGMYQLPVKEKVMLQFSYNTHNQDSYYGTVPYMAQQNIAFAQLYWDKQAGKKHTLLTGISYRHTFYDDNTPATASANGQKNQPTKTPLPGVLVQDEWSMNTKNKLLVGYRYDNDKHHGSVHSPRIAYKWCPDNNNTIRLSMGTGFRVVNLFTEDHAALTGSREVVIKEELKPEQSYNSNLNYTVKLPFRKGFAGIDITAFYSYFTNKIVGDFDTDPNKIIYDNLRGYAISQGVSLNTDVSFTFPLKLMAGVSYMNVFEMEDIGTANKQKRQQLFAPEWSGTFTATYSLQKHVSIDLTGNWNGPMRLPIVPNDYRPEYSPWFSIINIQLTKKFKNGIEIYGGVKNLFNFIPKNPILRPFDPFDKHVADPVNNPYGYTFDPSYNYSSLQGTRAFAGIRYNLFK